MLSPHINSHDRARYFCLHYAHVISLNLIDLWYSVVVSPISMKNHFVLAISSYMCLIYMQTTLQSAVSKNGAQYIYKEVKESGMCSQSNHLFILCVHHDFAFN